MKNNGILYALGAYFTWGLFPIYWKWLQAVPAPQLLSHRILWSFTLLISFIFLTRNQKELFRLAANRKTLAIYAAAALLIGVNWLVYVWAVNEEYIIETSLG